MILGLATLALLGGDAPPPVAPGVTVAAIAPPAPPIALSVPPEPDGAPVPDAPRPRAHAKGDPLEGFNRAMFGAHQSLDRAILRPASLGYKSAVPKPARSGIRNFFSNLTEPIVFLNYLLQFKPGKAVETLGRFVFNSTVGAGGLFDVAKTRGIRLPHRANGFGTTLALYGVKSGPYLFLPLVGPTTLRDFVGGQGDGLILPVIIGNPFDRLEYQLPKAVLTGLDQRAEADGDLKALFDGAVDPYATLRSVYLQNRQGEIDQIRGKPAVATGEAPELDDTLVDPAGAAAPPASITPELVDPLADPAAPIP